MKLTTKQYNFISQILWGCIPVDRKWAEETNIFKTRYQEILDKYPKLDASI